MRSVSAPDSWTHESQPISDGEEFSASHTSISASARLEICKAYEFPLRQPREKHFVKSSSDQKTDSKPFSDMTREIMMMLMLTCYMSYNFPSSRSKDQGMNCFITRGISADGTQEWKEWSIAPVLLCSPDQPVGPSHGTLLSLVGSCRSCFRAKTESTMLESPTHSLLMRSSAHDSSSFHEESRKEEEDSCPTSAAGQHLDDPWIMTSSFPSLRLQMRP